MPLLSSFQEDAKKAALAAMEKSSKTSQQLLASWQQQFGGSNPAPLSSTRAQFAAFQTSPTNDIVQAALDTALDATDAVLSDMHVLQHYITLTLPQMEDGGNFGVSIQLNALKAMSDAKEKLEKAVDELSKYHGARAEALEKCKLSTQTKTTTKTTSQTNASGNSTEKGDNQQNENKTVTEDKETGTETVSAAELVNRKQAVTAVDLLYFLKAKSLLQTAMTSYMGAVDFCDKNAEKLAQPKGDRGDKPANWSMY